ncbi:MAG: DEAD/DEAH box helicase family protein [Candidatus Lokiarchaeota archaeon]|nr:DEAD/DEAH box helicase family protein [Candidatus Lokiarchaeota archaeon]
MIFVTANEEFISHPLIKRNTISRREYQENIFINCLNRNCLVVIPTGLGKTIIALMLAVQRLTEFENSKVILLAPTKPLVEQHFKSFLDLTELPEESLISLTGAIAPEKRKELWTNIKVAFMTPQVLQNDLISRLYSIKDVSLIIFDECHRAVGDYAYCFIAKKYRDNSSNTQILGLTASPGSTEGKINEIKENIFIDHIEIRTEKDLDVKPYIHKVDNEWIKIKLPREFLEIKGILDEKLRNSYKILKENDLLGSYDISKITRKDILKLNHLINRRISTAKDDDEKFQMFNAKKIAANAIRLSHMTELIETQGISSLKDYFKKNEEKIRKNTANKSLRELFNDKDFKSAQRLTYDLHSKGLVHPKIEILKEILTNQINENSNSRILVFCHFRDSVNNIVKNFKEDDIIKMHKFVGQATRGSDKGLTQKEQIKLLMEFKEGIYNTLVGTSVAEEGLDIEECDLVVFYDVVPSAIRSIQRRGRTGRKKEGKVFVLMAEGTRDEGYYWAEKTKEKNMKVSLERIKNSDTQSKAGQSNLLNFISPEKSKETDSLEQNTKNLNLIKKIKGAEDFEIICDNRETASPVVRTLSLIGVNLKLEQLPIADYIISERVGIERKSAKDFNDSIIDGRLFTELSELGEKFSRPILILEGNPFKDSNIGENALYGAITSIIVNLDISIYKTENSIETAQFLYQLAKKEQSSTTSSLKLRFDKAPIETSRLLEYIVAGIPGVNTLRAKNLLKELKTLQNIFLSDIPDLTKIENIGKKIAQQIYKISRYKYKNSH